MATGQTHNTIPSEASLPEELGPEPRRILLDLARTAIDFGLTHGRPLVVVVQEYPPLLREARATFVTLHIKERLRGCIGSLEPHRPLAADVAHNAYAAAFLDHRFTPITSRELGLLDIHISILSLPVPMTFRSESDLLAQIRPGVDGLVLEEQGRRGTFLPSVWESLSNPQDFLSHLKLKAGLPPNHWSQTVRVARYTTESFP
ncbi:AmmeMemoRadiSam system protein A [Gammaproteobacteria bacterium]